MMMMTPSWDSSNHGLAISIIQYHDDYDHDHPHHDHYSDDHHLPLLAPISPRKGT